MEETEKKTKLTIDDIYATIASTEYIKLGLKTTVCFLTLRNGFEITATSSCVDPANYNEEIGKKLSYQCALDKVWELEGYLLQENQ